MYIKNYVKDMVIKACKNKDFAKLVLNKFTLESVLGLSKDYAFFYEENKFRFVRDVINHPNPSYAIDFYLKNEPCWYEEHKLAAKKILTESWKYYKKEIKHLAYLNKIDNDFKHHTKLRYYFQLLKVKAFKCDLKRVDVDTILLHDHVIFLLESYIHAIPLKKVIETEKD